ncbi:unnamed protein product [Protopolystoma xenopodis]|uniref:Uncharacterized protein n=1 Tax=Protopolystoma xenopodis TaxID=117903 RepID=A0A448X6J1_9PLAT|nr:unnamed protein product [Protopolystoma xenopodis]
MCHDLVYHFQGFALSSFSWSPHIPPPDPRLASSCQFRLNCSTCVQRQSGVLLKPYDHRFNQPPVFIGLDHLCLQRELLPWLEQIN